MRVTWYHDDFPSTTSRKYLRTNQSGSIQQPRTSETRPYTNLASTTIQSDQPELFPLFAYQLGLIMALWLTMAGKKWQEQLVSNDPRWISRAPKMAVESTNLIFCYTIETMVGCYQPPKSMGYSNFSMHTSLSILDHSWPFLVIISHPMFNDCWTIVGINYY